eukprot:1159839-Pelagomonas_calceolata.AAC.3
MEARVLILYCMSERANELIWACRRVSNYPLLLDECLASFFGTASWTHHSSSGRVVIGMSKAVEMTSMGHSLG